MTAITILVFCLAIVCGYYLRYGHQSRKSRLSPAASRPRNPYRATSIACGASGCAAVRAIEDKRFLSGRVPQFPLPGCSESSCRCHYLFHEDRRVSENRRALYSLNSDLYAVAGRDERRTRNGRRKLDTAPDKASGYNLDELNLTAR